MKLSTTQVLALGLVFNGAVSGCGLYRTSHFPAEETVPLMNFNYDGITGPLNWYGLNKTGNSLCDMGKQQSPINIASEVMGNTVSMVHGSTIDIDMPNLSGAMLENIGWTVEIVANTSTIKENGKTYKLTQFHYHTPSEHRIDSMYYPIEQHFVYESADADIKVITFFLDLDESGVTDEPNESIIKNIDAVAKPGSVGTTSSLDFSPLLANLKSNMLYSYVGSLTTPPCMEGLNFLISTKPIRISVATYKRLRSVLKFDARYTQSNPQTTNLLEVATKELSAKPSGAAQVRVLGALFPLVIAAAFWAVL